MASGPWIKWSVADDSTAELMRRFYGYLRQGKSKDEALRVAQLDLWFRSTLREPYQEKRCER